MKIKKYRIPRKIKKRMKKLEQLPFCSDENIKNLIDDSVALLSVRRYKNLLNEMEAFEFINELSKNILKT